MNIRAADIPSLGIQVSQGLLSYYTSWKGYTAEITSGHDTIEDLYQTFAALKETLARQGLDLPQPTRVEQCLGSCALGLERLQKKLSKLQTYGAAGSELAQTTPAEIRRLHYPFRRSTLAKLCEIIDDIQERLLPVAQLLNISAPLHSISTQIAVRNDTANFKYKSLDNDGFRLLLLLGARTGELECKLLHATLDSEMCAEYEALSYTWGDLALVETITVNDKTLRVTDNLYAALSYLRLPNEDRMLWTDAMCIDQGNDEERSRQVEKMGGIFRRAERVVIWLGKSTVETDSLMQWLQHSHERKDEAMGATKGDLADSELVASARTKRRRDLDEEIETNTKEVQVGVGDDTTGHDILRKELRMLLERSWFSRVWIVQEVANARAAIVCVGKQSVPAHLFSYAPTRLGLPIDSHCRSLLDLMPATSSFEPRRHLGWQLDTTLFKFQGCRASDERDKVYALWPVSSLDENAKQIGLDYTMETSAVIQRTVDYLVETKQHSTGKILDFLASFNSLTTVCLVFHMDSTFSSGKGFLDDAGVRQLLERRIDRTDAHEQSTCWFVEQQRSPQDRKTCHNQAFQIRYWGIVLRPGEVSLRSPWWDEVKKNVTVVLISGSIEEFMERLSALGYEFGVKTLLEQGADVNGLIRAPEHLRSALLQAASSNGHKAVAEMLLEYGADVNAQGGRCGHALQVAACHGKEELVEMLLERGANINAQGGRHGNALRAALRLENWRMVKMLRARGADSSIEP